MLKLNAKKPKSNYELWLSGLGVSNNGTLVQG